MPNGSISFQLNADATVIASPFGFVAADIPVVFQFDDAGALIQPAKLYSNGELNPQNYLGLGTYYLVTFYDQNGARLNFVPMWWQFPEASGATVDISAMTPFATVGGNVIYYPTIMSVVPNITITAGTPTTIVGQIGLGSTVGFGNGTPSTAVTTTTKGTGSGPITPQTVVGYLEIDVAGTKFWMPYCR